MLVITRKPTESFIVGRARVTILLLDNNRVKIGIDAPPDVKILRSELATSAALDTLNHAAQVVIREKTTLP